MTIKVTTAIYFVVTLVALIWFFVDLFTVTYGGNFWSGKRKGELGLTGTLVGLFWVIYTLIWGGFFWW
jgi:hypothetical protein